MGLIHDIQKYQILQWDPYFHHSGDGWLSRKRIFLNLDLNSNQSYISSEVFLYTILLKFSDLAFCHSDFLIPFSLESHVVDL